MDSFIYLRIEINSTLDLTETVTYRLRKANAVFAMLLRIWSATRLPTTLKARMFHSVVRPVALYGAETWTLLPSLEHVVDTQDMEWVRQIAGVSMYDELPNAVVRRRARCPVPLSEACRQARLRYYGHLCRLPEGRAPISALHATAGPRRQGRPTTTWAELVAADARTRGLCCDDLHRLAPDRDLYRGQVAHAPRCDGVPTHPLKRPRPG